MCVSVASCTRSTPLQSSSSFVPRFHSDSNRDLIFLSHSSASAHQLPKVPHSPATLSHPSLSAGSQLPPLLKFQCEVKSSQWSACWEGVLPDPPGLCPCHLSHRLVPGTVASLCPVLLIPCHHFKGKDVELIQQTSRWALGDKTHA